MGIEQVYQGVSPDVFQDLMAHPEKAESFFYGSFDDDEVMQAHRANLESSDAFFDLKNDWQAIHFMLTGEFAFAGESRVPPPLCNVVMGGAETPFECTYGFVRFLTPVEVRDVSNALAQISEADLHANLTAEKFNAAKVYPARENWDQEELDVLPELFEELRQFFQKTAAAGNYLLISSE